MHGVSILKTCITLYSVKNFSRNFYAFWAYAFEAIQKAEKITFFTLHRYKKGKTAKFMPNTGNTVAKIFTVYYV